MRSRFLAFLLVLAIWPSTAETLEYAMHWIEYGDAAHSAGDAHDRTPLGADEHGCSGMFHVCSCHVASPGATPTAMTLPRGMASCGQRDVPTPLDHVGLGPTAPPIRPPIA